MQWGEFWPPPTLRKLLNRFWWNLNLRTTPKDYPPCKISFLSKVVDGLGEYSDCHCKVSVSFFLSFFHFWSIHHVHRLHRWTDFDDLYVIWCLSAQVCAFSGFRWYAFPFRGSNPPKPPILGAWIGVLQPNWWNRKTCILSKLLHRFQPNFAQ